MKTEPPSAAHTPVDNELAATATARMTKPAKDIALTESFDDVPTRSVRATEKANVSCILAPIYVLRMTVRNQDVSAAT